MSFWEVTKYDRKTSKGGASNISKSVNFSKHRLKGGGGEKTKQNTTSLLFKVSPQVSHACEISPALSLKLGPSLSEACQFGGRRKGRGGLGGVTKRETASPPPKREEINDFVHPVVASSRPLCKSMVDVIQCVPFIDPKIMIFKEI